MEKKSVPTWLNILLIVFIVLGIANSVYLIFVDKSTSIILNIVSIICGVFAIIYCLNGYKKNTALIFKLFCIAYAITKAIPMFYVTALDVNMFEKALWLADLAAICVFVFSKDLGRKNAFLFAGIIIVCAVLKNIDSLLYDSSFSGILSVLGSLAIALMFGVMVYAKYQDKASRGTN